MLPSELVAICQEVFDELGTGHTEKVYQKGIISLLNDYEIFHRSEVSAPIYMRGDVVGHGRADIVVGRLVVELKAVSYVPTKVNGQLDKYVKSLNKDKMDMFNQRCVSSTFFRTDSSPKNGNLLDVDYREEMEKCLNDMYTGLIINFNQKTESIEMVMADNKNNPKKTQQDNNTNSHQKKISSQFETILQKCKGGSIKSPPRGILKKLQCVSTKPTRNSRPCSSKQVERFKPGR